MEPLKITITLSSPICRDNDNPIHLDGLLAWCVMDEAESLGHENPWKISEDLHHLLANEPYGDGQFVWKASILKMTPVSEPFWINMTRTLDHEQIAELSESGLVKQKRSYINSGSGQERNFQLLMPYQWLKTIEAWCIGDQEEISMMLNRLTTIGKHGRNGFGRISKIEVKHCADAEDLWRLRFLPEEMPGANGVAYIPSFRPLCPPYWKKNTKTSSKEPVLMS